MHPQHEWFKKIDSACSSGQTPRMGIPLGGLDTLAWIVSTPQRSVADTIELTTGMSHAEQIDVAAIMTSTSTQAPHAYDRSRDANRGLAEGRWRTATDPWIWSIFAGEAYTATRPLQYGRLESTWLPTGRHAPQQAVTAGTETAVLAKAVTPRLSGGYWWSGRYSTAASQPGAYQASGGRVFPTRRNSGLRSEALRGAQEAFTRVRLLENAKAEMVRGQAREAGLTVLNNGGRLADPGAEKAVQRAINWYNNRQSKAGCQ